MKKEIEISRSFSYKLGQPNYSSVDFFCSITDTCNLEDKEEVSNSLHLFAKQEVQKSITEFLAGIEAKKKAEEEADKEKVVAQSNKVSAVAEKKEKSKQSAELSAGDIEIVPEIN